MIALALALLCITVDDWPEDVSNALELAGPNRSEIEAFLEHQAQSGDAQKLRAACFLVANMPGHGYIEYALCDGDGNEVPFDAPPLGSLHAAQAALDALEVQHGDLEFKKKVLVEDLHTLSAEALTLNLDLAFDAWRTNPWARGVSFETFCEYVLPHRGSNEPAENWRGPTMESLSTQLEDLGPDPDLGAVTGRVSAYGGRLGFSDIYYLHPTDQGFAEMNRTGRGRCEDQTNMTTYALRAAAIVGAADYTPWWGHRDNNHAWAVLLDGAGRGNSGAGNRAAKVYRKTYSHQLGNLVFQLAEGEQAPPWLDRMTYKDVTDQYKLTSDVSVRLTQLRDQRFAYLCVFNGGEWRPIHWGRAEDGAVNFDRMGRGLVYLPAHWIEGEVRPAAPPLHLDSGARVRAFVASTEITTSAGVPAKAGETYRLFVWREGWELLGERTAEGDALRWEDVPAGALYWQVQNGSRRLERVFALRPDGTPEWM